MAIHDVVRSAAGRWAGLIAPHKYANVELVGRSAEPPPLHWSLGGESNS
jgi:hypothetical protein